MSGVQTLTVADGEDGMRLDRWFSVHFPNLPFGRVQKIIRTGQVRINGSRAQTNSRIESGQQIRVPPIDMTERPEVARINPDDAAFLRDIVIYEDNDVFVFNKPHGLAVQGGSGTKVHLDGMLKSLPDRDGETPRLVHRLDRDTSGCLLVARSRAAATHFGAVFRSRSARKIYWAITVGVPVPHQGKASCFLVKQPTRDGEQMVVAEHGDEGAQHSVTYFSVTDQAGERFAWVTLKPVTGRTHQLRVHMNLLGTPILDDPRYFDRKDFEKPEQLGDGLHLHARRLAIPLMGGKRLDVSAPLPPHMAQTFDALGFDANQYDAQNADPEED